MFLDDLGEGIDFIACSFSGKGEIQSYESKYPKQ